MQVKTEEIFEKLSKKHKLPKFVIEAIWKSQFDFVADVIKSGDPEDSSTMKSVYLRNFGKFYCKKNVRR